MTDVATPNVVVIRDGRLTVAPLWPDDAARDLADVLQLTEGWQRDANCASAHWALFDPPQDREAQRTSRGDVRWPRRVLEAARYCVGCPVLDRCRARAEETQSQGVWAGAWRTGSGGKHTVRPIPVPRDDAA